MRREKQIEEMFNLIVDGVIDGEDNHGVPTGKTCFDIAESLYNAGYRKQSEWISVEERLPDGNGRFLTVDKKGDMMVCYWEKRFGWFASVCNKNAITHWMPLPEPPKGE